MKLEMFASGADCALSSWMRSRLHPFGQLEDPQTACRGRTRTFLRHRRRPAPGCLVGAPSCECADARGAWAPARCRSGHWTLEFGCVKKVGLIFAVEGLQPTFHHSVLWPLLAPKEVRGWKGGPNDCQTLSSCCHEPERMITGAPTGYSMSCLLPTGARASNQQMACW